MGLRDRFRGAFTGEVSPAEQPATAPLPEEPTRQRGEGPDLVAIGELDRRGRDLAGINWSGANLQGVNLEGANLTGANLANADLAYANLTRANLTDANLGGARLGNAKLYEANFTGVDLTDADLTDAKFSAVFDRGGPPVFALNLDKVVSWSGARRGNKLGEEARRDIESDFEFSRAFRTGEAEAHARAELGED